VTAFPVYAAPTRNMTIIEGDTDCFLPTIRLLSNETARARSDFLYRQPPRQRRSRPVIYTHSHADTWAGRKREAAEEAASGRVGFER